MDDTQALLSAAKLSEAPPAPAARRELFAADIRVTGQPLDPANAGQIIKPRELVDIVEITPLTRNESILYNQLLAHAWPTIRDAGVHKILKSTLRGSHESNDRLHDAFDKLMGAYAKIRARDPKTGAWATYRMHLLGTNKAEDKDDGYFYYTFPPDLLAVIVQSRAWATIKSHIMYSLRSKYSLRLYEMIERRIGLMKQYEELSVEEFRQMLGVPGDKLPRFADFNKHCLKPAIAEVNQLSDFTVSVMAVSKGRVVDKLALAWCRKSGTALKLAHDERERSRVGRTTRRTGSTTLVIADIPA